MRSAASARVRAACNGRVREQLPQVIGRDRSAEVESLTVVATHRLQYLLLLRGLDPLGYGPYAEIFRKLHDAADDGVFGRIAGQTEHEILVDLQGRDRQMLESTQR